MLVESIIQVSYLLELSFDIDHSLQIESLLIWVYRLILWIVDTVVYIVINFFVGLLEFFFEKVHVCERYQSVRHLHWVGFKELEYFVRKQPLDEGIIEVCYPTQVLKLFILINCSGFVAHDFIVKPFDSKLIFNLSRVVEFTWSKQLLVVDVLAVVKTIT